MRPLRPHRVTAAAASLAAIGLLFSACGDSKKAAEATPTTTAAAADGVNAAAVALLPEAVKAKGTLTVAVDASYPPDEMIDTDGKTIIGMDPDLMYAIGAALGLDVTLENATFDTIIPGLVSGKFDVGASSFTDTKERELQVDFVTYFRAGMAFYVPMNSTTEFNGLESLCGHTVAVQRGTVQETDSTTQDASCKSAGKPGVTVLSFDDQNDTNLAVSSGRAEVGFADSQVAAYIAAQSNGQFKLSGLPFATAPYGLAMAKSGLAPAIKAALEGLIQNGTYTAILAKWGLQDGAITTPVINGAEF